MNVLIVKTSSLGDIVHALPAAVYLKQINPQCHLHWLVEEAFAEVLEPLPYIDQVLPLNLRRIRKGHSLFEMGKLWKTIRFIRQQKYDWVFDLQGNTKSGFFTRLSGAQKRFGFGRNGVREWPNLLATNHKTPLTETDHHVSDRSLAIIRSAFPNDFRPPDEGYLQAPSESVIKVDKWLVEKNWGRKEIVVCHIGTTWPTKLWPLDNWTSLIRWMIDEKDILPVLTWGNPAEKIMVENLARDVGQPFLLWMGGSLGDLTALLDKAALVVGSDTGPIHMAAALGTPTVSFYRATDGSRNGPRGEKHVRLQVPLNCSPCLRKRCERDEECGHSIRLEEVRLAVENLMT